MTRDPMPFLLARVGEDHGAIDAVLLFLRSLPPKEPRAYPEPGITFTRSGTLEPDRFVPMVHLETEAFTARHDPDRARFEAEAREKIANEHRETEGHVCGVCVIVMRDRPEPVRYPCPTLQALTWAYAHHPEYDTAWDHAL